MGKKHEEAKNDVWRAVVQVWEQLPENG